ncbi:hypothetical protein Hanom_Chr03g00231521 [Helianthus anomalus]
MFLNQKNTITFLIRDHHHHQGCCQLLYLVTRNHKIVKQVDVAYVPLFSEYLYHRSTGFLFINLSRNLQTQTPQSPKTPDC